MKIWKNQQTDLVACCNYLDIQQNSHHHRVFLVSSRQLTMIHIYRLLCLIRMWFLWLFRTTRSWGRKPGGCNERGLRVSPGTQRPLPGDGSSRPGVIQFEYTFNRDQVLRLNFNCFSRLWPPDWTASSYQSTLWPDSTMLWRVTLTCPCESKSHNIKILPKTSLEMEGAPRCNWWDCWHCWNCYTLLSKMLNGWGWVIPLRLLWLLEHLQC